ncbi:MAG TPA: adenosylmethionine--8-amino-7-oxononanoate transaminase [Gammaproteobacteria bacterium]|nr:adenosylmethionine--8-amino-7-oxononanoate transaminase [Gammaproteobacteria bacterium]
MKQFNNPLWLPYTQMHNVELPPVVVATSGSQIHLEDHKILIDGIASWWSACHGYNHPCILQAMQEQLSRMPHVMLGGFTHAPALTLAQKLSELLGPDLNHVFYSESGSVAVEVALKIALQYWINQDNFAKTTFMHFQHSYHGDTFLTMSLCDPEQGMHRKFNHILNKHYCLSFPANVEDLLQFEVFLEKNHHMLAGLIVEPLVQAAGGMKFHTMDMLKALVLRVQDFGIPVIFDEIFTGFGRTGSLFAFEQIGVKPDIICLGKALTGGVTPLSATIASTKLYNQFLSDKVSDALMHGPTFMGHALGCAAALASCALFSQEPRLAQVQTIETYFKEIFPPFARYAMVKETRVKGAIGVIQLHARLTTKQLKWLNHYFLQQGVWIRPFGDIIYLTPAFTIPMHELEILIQALHFALSGLQNLL